MSSLLSRRHLPNVAGAKNKGRTIPLTEAEISDQNAGKNVTVLLGFCAIVVVLVILFRIQTTPPSLHYNNNNNNNNNLAFATDKILVEDDDYAPKNEYNEEDLAKKEGSKIATALLRKKTQMNDDDNNNKEFAGEGEDIAKPNNDVVEPSASEGGGEKEENVMEQLEKEQSMEMVLREEGEATTTQAGNADEKKRAREESLNAAGGAGRIASLGNFLFSDAKQYEAAPFIVVNREDGKPFKGMWSLLLVHEEYYSKHPHKRYVPRLAQTISREEFHRVFRITSTPVIIPFEFSRKLGFLTQQESVAELRKKWPYEPPPSYINSYVPPEARYSKSSGRKTKLDLGPALYAIAKDSKLEKIAYGVRNFPRNLQLSSKNLAQLKVSRPPYIQAKRFQPASVWFGTSTSDTKFHHDCCDNFVMMIAGTKRWFLAPVTDWRTMRPIRCEGDHQSLCWSSVPYPNSNNLTEAQKQVVSKLNSILVELNPGDSLYLPAGWWHHIQNLGPTVMLNHWTMGCQNVGLALELDPNRADRPEFKGCALNAKAESTWRSIMDEKLIKK